jgi:drug/metabolite transporter (DMT)-like permease
MVRSSATRTGFEWAPIIDNPWAAPNRCAASRTFESNPLMMRIRVLLFGEFPDLWTWIGALIIVVSGIYMIYGEKRAGRP